MTFKGMCNLGNSLFNHTIIKNLFFSKIDCNKYVPVSSAVHYCTEVKDRSQGLGEGVASPVRGTGLSCRGSGHWGSEVGHWASFPSAEDHRSGRVEAAGPGGTEVCWDTVVGSSTVAHTVGKKTFQCIVGITFVGVL